MPLPIIWIIGMAVAGIATASVWKFSNMFKDPAKRKLGILGMPGAGKTLFLNYLRDVAAKPVETGLQENYDAFTYTTANGIEIPIEAGFDISGLDENRSQYLSIMNNSDVVFYFFDLSRYLNESKYSRNCNSRFFDLHEYFEKNQEKKLVLFASHIDLCPFDRSKTIGIFRKQIKDKAYKTSLEKTHFINLTDEKELKETTDLIFEKQ